MPRGVVSIGSNLEDRMSYLQLAVETLAERMGHVLVSPVYETAPIGVTDQPFFLNALLLVHAPSADALLAAGQEAERRAGRTRERRWGPRTLDVDVISVGDLTSSDPRLTLPHPRAQLRAFVLAPWLDLDPDAELIGHGRVSDLLAAVDATGVRRRDDLVLVTP